MREWLVLRATREHSCEDLGAQCLRAAPTEAVRDFFSTLDKPTPTGARFLLCPHTGDQVEALDR